MLIEGPLLQTVSKAALLVLEDDEKVSAFCHRPQMGKKAHLVAAKRPQSDLLSLD